MWVLDEQYEFVNLGKKRIVHDNDNNNQLEHWFFFSPAMLNISSLEYDGLNMWNLNTW